MEKRDLGKVDRSFKPNIHLCNWKSADFLSLSHSYVEGYIDEIIRVEIIPFDLKDPCCNHQSTGFRDLRPV